MAGRAGRGIRGWPDRAEKTGKDDIHGAFFQQSSFATRAIALESNVIKVDHDTDLQVFAPLGCGFQAGAGAIMNTLRPRFGAGIVVFGVGNVGLAAIAAAKAKGAGGIIAVGPVVFRRALAVEFGARADICLGTTGRP